MVFYSKNAALEGVENAVLRLQINTVLRLQIKFAVGHAQVHCPYQGVNFVNRKINLNVIIKSW